MQSSFRKNVVRLLTSSVMAQAVAVFSLPVLGRFVTPDQFGVFGIVAAFVGITASFSTWQFDKFMPLSRTRALVIHLFVAGMLMVIFWTVVLSLCIYFFEEYVYLYNTNLVPSALLYVVPVAVFARGLQRLFHFLHVWGGNLGSVGLSRIVQAVSDVAISIALAYLGFGAVALVFGLALSLIMSLVPMMVGAKDFIKWRSTFRLSRLVKSGRLRVVDSTRATGILFANSLSTNVAVVLIGLWFSALEVGLFTMVRRVGLAPLGVISFSLSLSFWSRISLLCKNGSYSAARLFYFRVVGYLCCLAILMLTVIYFASGYLDIALGSNWEGAGDILFALGPMLVGTLLFGSTNHLVSLGQQGLQIIADGCRLLGVTAAVGICHMLDVDFLVCVWALSLVSCLSYVILFGIHLYVYRNLLSTIR